MLAAELPRKHTPAPANVTFEVEAKITARLGCPDAGTARGCRRSGVLLGQVVHGVGVVPEDAKVRRSGLERGELGAPPR